jgi:hypothetical protein
LFAVTQYLTDYIEVDKIKISKNDPETTSFFKAFILTIVILTVSFRKSFE